MPSRTSMAYGLDPSSGRIVLVRARRRGTGVAFEVVHDAKEPLAEHLRLAIETEVRRGTAVTAAALPAFETVLRPLRVPFPRIDQARRVLPSLLDVQLPFPLERAVCVFTAAHPDPAGGLNVLGLAARNEDVDKACVRSREAGVDPVELHPEAVAIWARAAGRETTGRLLFGLHLGSQHSTLVWGRGGRLHGAFSARGDATTADGLDALARRIVAWLRTVDTGRGEDTTWRISGLVPPRPELERFRSACAIPETVAIDPDAPTALARALAEQALAGGEHFRTGPCAHPAAASRADRQGRRSLLLATFSAAAVLAASIGAPLFAHAVNERLQDRNARRASELAGTPVPRGQEVLGVERALANASDPGRTFDLAMRGGTAGELFELIDQARRAGLILCAIRGSAQTWRVEGSGDAEALATALRGRGWQVKISPAEEHRFVLEGRRT